MLLGVLGLRAGLQAGVQGVALAGRMMLLRRRTRQGLGKMTLPCRSRAGAADAGPTAAGTGAGRSKVDRQLLLVEAAVVLGGVVLGGLPVGALGVVVASSRQPAAGGAAGDDFHGVMMWRSVGRCRQGLLIVWAQYSYSIRLALSVLCLRP